ncbi:unnamed protein product [Ectocarpus sp. CCAP 1310/34]|nr:unnamed protein product [Ectocarpus sp. CCAP 1310/34]
MGGRAGAEELVGAGREEEEEWSVGLELHDETFGSGGSVSLGLVSPAPAAVPDRGADGGIYDPHACSARMTPTSSSSSLSRLCWGSGGTGDSAGGGGRDVTRGGRPRRHTRRDHVDMLSQLEAEGVFAADDSYSPCGGGGGSRGGGGMGGVAFSPEARSMFGGDGESSRPGGCREELLTLTAIKQEEEEGGSVPCEMPLLLSSEVKQELSEDKPLVSAAAAAAAAVAAAAAAEPQATTAGGALCSGGTAPLVEKTVTKEAAAAVTPPSSEPETARAAVAPDPNPAAAAAEEAAAVSGESTTATGPFARPKSEPVPAPAPVGASLAGAAVYSAAAVPDNAARTASSEPRRSDPGEPRVSTEATRAAAMSSTAAAAAAAPGAAGEGAPTAPVFFSAEDVGVGVGATGEGLSRPCEEGYEKSRDVTGAIRRCRDRFGDAVLVEPILQEVVPRHHRAISEQFFNPIEESSRGSDLQTKPEAWLLVRQECPTCHKMQIPRVDILNPTNNVESHIAFLTENASDGDGSCMDWDGETSDDNSGDEYSGDERQGFSAGGSMSGGDGSGLGTILDSDQAAKLLVLMCHARHCPGNHRSARLAEVCRSVKFLMLHLRDCDGKTRNGDPCPMPWCEPCTSLLHHLIQCPESTGCKVCDPEHLPPPLQQLRALNRSSSTLATAQPQPQQQQQQQQQQQRQQPPPPPPPPPTQPQQQ